MTKRAIDLEKITDEDLLCCRICDLPLKIEGTWLQECVRELYKELQDKGIVFQPECYLADEWLTPENETCIGIPFYLAHPTLVRLEKKFMLEAEGEGNKWCMKLLRHETGHALCYAYRFHKRKAWRKLFGPSSLEYGDTYKFRPYSKNFVRHIDGFYAQYHPDEDFVETFAVWLTPQLDWRTQYKDWKVIEKLNYVDSLMQEIRGKSPLIKSKRKLWRLSTLRKTLKTYYKGKRQLWAEDFPDFHDSFLNKTFVQSTENNAKSPRAVELIRRHKKNIINSVSRSSGERKYIVNDLVSDIQKRCQDLQLVVADDETPAMISLSSYIASLIMNYLYTGRFRGRKRKI